MTLQKRWDRPLPSVLGFQGRSKWEREGRVGGGALKLLEENALSSSFFLVSN